MARTTKIVGFSLPPEVHRELENLIQQKHKTRSEFLRELIDTYADSARTISRSTTREEVVEGESPNLAKILQSFWDVRSESPLKVIVVGLGIIVNSEGKVLIGARQDKDPWVKNLSWVFPGGGIGSFEFETEVKNKVLAETGLEVEIHSLISTRLHPDAYLKKAQVVTLYFHCTTSGNKPLKAGHGLVELKWVKPTEVYKFFTNSTNDDVARFLSVLEESN